MYSMTRPDLSPYSPLAANAANPIRPFSPSEADAIRTSSQHLFLDLNLFFVKVADLMFIAPSVPHLRNLKLDVHYHEVLPNAGWLARFALPPGKWKQDSDSESYLGFAPGTRSYVNGDLVAVGGAKVAAVSASSFPVQPVPDVGLAEMKKGEPEYKLLASGRGMQGESVNGSVSKEKTNGHVKPEQGEERKPKHEEGEGITNGVGANGIL